MKVLIFILAFSVLSGCASQATSLNDAESLIQPSPTIENSNANNQNQFAYTDYKFDQSEIDRLSEESDRFRQKPDEFKSADFENFNFLFGKLKNGKYKDGDPDNPLAGSQSYTLSDVFYIDLTGDDKKEAIVFIYEVSCGASCDGGREIIYFYSSQKGKPNLIDFFETGANAGGCSLKSFTVKEKKIYIEQFGKCIKDSKIDEKEGFFCKFCVKDETHKIFTLSEKGLKQESVKIVETGQINVMNSPSIISINE